MSRGLHIAYPVSRGSISRVPCPGEAVSCGVPSSVSFIPCPRASMFCTPCPAGLHVPYPMSRIQCPASREFHVPYPVSHGEHRAVGGAVFRREWLCFVGVLSLLGCVISLGMCVSGRRSCFIGVRIPRDGVPCPEGRWPLFYWDGSISRGVLYPAGWGVGGACVPCPVRWSLSHRIPYPVGSGVRTPEGPMGSLFPPGLHFP